MDLAHPISSVIPSAHGAVLAVLSGTNAPMSGRRVAELTGGRVSQKGANDVLGRLTRAGIVLVEDQPPAKLYRLNRRHLAAEHIIGLTQLRPSLISALEQLISKWEAPPSAAWLFGSAARGDGDDVSDIDVLVVRPDDVEEDHPGWASQLDELAELVPAWTGNQCSVVEFTESEFVAMVSAGERLADELRRDGIRLAGNLTIPTRADRGRP